MENEIKAPDGGRGRIEPVFWRAKDAAQALCCSMAGFWNLTKLPGFPRARKVTSRFSVWSREEVLGWVASRPLAEPSGTGRPRKGKA
ncbi:MAG: hypothetical protein LBW85_13510 [Deltaproteobacteria bacterium]|nr:hypothetical protein [Deltaproteobacteria bacterium]